MYHCRSEGGEIRIISKTEDENKGVSGDSWSKKQKNQDTEEESEKLVHGESRENVQPDKLTHSDILPKKLNYFLNSQAFVNIEVAPGTNSSDLRPWHPQTDYPFILEQPGHVTTFSSGHAHHWSRGSVTQGYTSWQQLSKNANCTKISQVSGSKLPAKVLGKMQFDVTSLSWSLTSPLLSRVTASATRVLSGLATEHKTRATEPETAAHGGHPHTEGGDHQVDSRGLAVTPWKHCVSTCTSDLAEKTPLWGSWGWHEAMHKVADTVIGTGRDSSSFMKHSSMEVSTCEKSHLLLLCSFQHP